MIVSQTKKGAAVWNTLILLLIVIVGVIAAMSVLKIRKDPKNPDDLRATLGLKKK